MPRIGLATDNHVWDKVDYDIFSLQEQLHWASKKIYFKYNVTKLKQNELLCIKSLIVIKVLNTDFIEM